MRRASSPRRALAPIVLGLGLASAVPAFAQSTGDRATARKLFEDGKTKRDRGDKEGALEAFRQADAIMQVPTTRLALARALAVLDRLVEARDVATSVERIPAAGKEPQPFIDARGAAVDLLKELDARIPTLVFELGDSAADATVTVDGLALGEGTLTTPHKVNPGKHTVVISASGKTTNQEITVAEKETRTIRLDTAAPAPPSPVNHPVTGPKSAAGRPLLWIGLGVLVVGLGTGAVGGIISMGKKSDLDSGCPDGRCPPPTHDTLDAAHTWATVSTIGFIGAGVGAALAGVGLLLGGRPGAPAQGTTTAVRPTLTLGSAGLEGVF